MSAEAMEYVRLDPAVRALPAAEKFLLRTIAMLHKLEVNCAFAKMSYLAEQTMTSDRNCRRLVTSLVKKGLLVRHAAERQNGSQVSNEYELPGMRVSTAVTEQARQQVFKTPRNRKAAQLTLSLLGDEGETPSDANGGLQGSAVAEADQRNRGFGLGCAVDEQGDSACAKPEVDVLLPPDSRCPPPPGQQVSALEVVFEVVSEVLPPPSPAYVAETWKSKSADQRQERRTTARARAKATATTPVLREPGVSMERAGATGASSGGRVIPFRGRSRDPEVERAGLDGHAAALFDETMRVLGECGIGPKCMTRRQRVAVSEALMIRADREGCSLAEAGVYLVERRELYLQCRHALTKLVDVRRFYSEGYCWDERIWDWTIEAKNRMAQQSKASVGMYR